MRWLSTVSDLVANSRVSQTDTQTSVTVALHNTHFAVCGICRERGVDTILACSHSFCEQCLDKQERDRLRIGNTILLQP